MSSDTAIPATAPVAAAAPVVATAASNAARRRTRVLVGLATLVVLAYLPAIQAVGTGGWPFSDDAIGLMSVWRGLARESLSNGLLPLWNPRIFCGLPFMSNGQTAVLYPPNFIYYIMPMPPALLLDALLHNILLVWGAYALARALRLSRAASCLTAIAMGLGGGVASHIYTGHMTWHAARAYIPWELCFLLLYLRSGSRRYAVYLALALALQMASGYPPLVLLSTALCGGLLVAWCSSHRDEEALPRGWIAAALLVVGLAGALSAITVLPLKEASNLSVHGSGLKYDLAVALSGSWRSLARLILPEFFGGNNLLQWSMPWGAHEEAAYIGLFTVVLAVGAPWFARRFTAYGDGAPTAQLPRAVWWLWALLPVSAVLAVGSHTPVYGFLFEHVAIWRQMRVPVRWLEVWVLCASLLAGFSFDGCLHRASLRAAGEENGPSAIHDLMLAMIGIAVLALGLVALLLKLPSGAPQWMNTVLWTGAERDLGIARPVAAETLHRFALHAAVVGVLAAAIPAWLLSLRQRQMRAGETRKVRRCELGLLAFAACDVLLLFWSSEHTVDAHAIRDIDPWPASLVKYHTPGARWNTGLPWHTLNRGMLQGIDLYNGYDALGGKRYFDFASAVEDNIFWIDMYQSQLQPPLLRVAGVTHTIASIIQPIDDEHELSLEAIDGHWKLWRHDGAWPRVYVTRHLLHETGQEQLTLLGKLSKQSFSALGQPAVTDKADFPQIGSALLTPRDRVLKWSEDFNSLHAEVQTSAPAVVVDSEVLYPGWRAWVKPEGAAAAQPALVKPANYLFRGVAVPAGKSQIAIVYDSETFRFGTFVTLCGLSMLTAMGVWLKKAGL